MIPACPRDVLAAIGAAARQAAYRRACNERKTAAENDYLQAQF
jgi:hypothetical protein